jgi:hypothetical protein
MVIDNIFVERSIQLSLLFMLRWDNDFCSTRHARSKGQLIGLSHCIAAITLSCIIERRAAPAGGRYVPAARRTLSQRACDCIQDEREDRGQRQDATAERAHAAHTTGSRRGTAGVLCTSDGMRPHRQDRMEGSKTDNEEDQEILHHRPDHDPAPHARDHLLLHSPRRRE